MSALCAFPPLMPAAGGVYSAGYMADVSASSGRIGSFAAVASSAFGHASQQQQQHHQQQQQQHQQQQQNQSRLAIPAYGSTFTAFHHPSAAMSGMASSKSAAAMMMPKIAQPESAWSSRSSASLAGNSSSAIDVPPAAKRRCTDKARSGTSSSTGWVEQHAQSLWSSSASTCPSGCTMCHIQQQQQQHQQQQQQQHVYSHNGFVASTSATPFDARRPLQEKHQNREDASLSAALLPSSNNNSNVNVSTSHSLKPLSKPSNAAMGANQVSPSIGRLSGASTLANGVMVVGNRTLAVDPKKDYSAPLHVDCSVEYDLPRIVRPPPGAQPLLILAAPRHSTSSQMATPSTGYQSSSSWTSCRPLPPQWNQQTGPSAQSSNRVKTNDGKQQQQQQPVKSHPAAMQPGQQQAVTKLNPSGAAVRKSIPCGCPSCCLRPANPSAVPPVNVYAAATGLSGGAGWMNQHWSPPAGATASSAGFGYALQQQQQQQQQQPQQQQPQAGYQMASFHAINHDQQQVQQQQQTAANSRRRKRSPEAMPTAADKIQRLYSTAQWMPDPSIQAAFLAVAASQRYVTPSPAAWTMASSAQPIKFHC